MLNPTGPMAGKFICAALLATSCWASPSSKPPGATRSAAFVSPSTLGRAGGARRRGDATCTSMSSTAAEDDVKGTAPKKVILICTGDACEDEGSRQLLKCARATIPGELVCKSTGCLGMCGKGPVVGTQAPGGAMELRADVLEEDLPDIFAAALEAP